MRLMAAFFYLWLLGGCATTPDFTGERSENSKRKAQPSFAHTDSGGQNLRMNELVRPTERLLPLQRPMPPVRPGDWRSFWKENSQTPQAYAADHPMTLTAERKVLYLCRVGVFTAAQEVMAQKIKEYLAVCFQCEVRFFADIALVSFPDSARRTGPNRQMQINSVYLTDKLLKPKLPGDAWGVMAITWLDIFSGAGLSEQYGDSLLYGRAGVISFYHLNSNDPVLRLERALKGASHESGHLLSIPHCSHYLCNMNGRAGLNEFDRSPLHFCTDCLPKFLFATGADPMRRFAELTEFCDRNGIPEATYFRQAARLWTSPTGH